MRAFTRPPTALFKNALGLQVFFPLSPYRGELIKLGVFLMFYTIHAWNAFHERVCGATALRGSYPCPPRPLWNRVCHHLLRPGHLFAEVFFRPDDPADIHDTISFLTFMVGGTVAVALGHDIPGLRRSCNWRLSWLLLVVVLAKGYLVVYGLLHPTASLGRAVNTMLPPHAAIMLWISFAFPLVWRKQAILVSTYVAFLLLIIHMAAERGWPYSGDNVTPAAVTAKLVTSSVLSVLLAAIFDRRNRSGGTAWTVLKPPDSGPLLDAHVASGHAPALHPQPRRPCPRTGAPAADSGCRGGEPLPHAVPAWLLSGFGNAMAAVAAAAGSLMTAAGRGLWVAACAAAGIRIRRRDGGGGSAAGRPCRPTSAGARSALAEDVALAEATRRLGSLRQRRNISPLGGRGGAVAVTAHVADAAGASGGSGDGTAVSLGGAARGAAPLLAALAATARHPPTDPGCAAAPATEATAGLQVDPYPGLPVSGQQPSCQLHADGNASGSPPVAPAAAAAFSAGHVLALTGGSRRYYRSRPARVTRMYIKLNGVVPEQLEPAVAASLAAELAGRDFLMVGFAVRSGCIEVVLELSDLRGAGDGGPGDAAGPGGGGVSAELILRVVSVLGSALRRAPPEAASALVAGPEERFHARLSPGGGCGGAAAARAAAGAMSATDAPARSARGKATVHVGLDGVSYSLSHDGAADIGAPDGWRIWVNDPRVHDAAGGGHAAVRGPGSVVHSAEAGKAAKCPVPEQQGAGHLALSAVGRAAAMPMSPAAGTSAARWSLEGPLAVIPPCMLLPRPQELAPGSTVQLSPSLPLGPYWLRQQHHHLHQHHQHSVLEFMLYLRGSRHGVKPRSGAPVPDVLAWQRGCFLQVLSVVEVRAPAGSTHPRGALSSATGLYCCKVVVDAREASYGLITLGVRKGSWCAATPAAPSWEAAAAVTATGPPSATAQVLLLPPDLEAVAEELVAPLSDEAFKAVAAGDTEGAQSVSDFLTDLHEWLLYDTCLLSQPVPPPPLPAGAAAAGGGPLPTLVPAPPPPFPHIAAAAAAATGWHPDSSLRAAAGIGSGNSLMVVGAFADSLADLTFGTSAACTRTGLPTPTLTVGDGDGASGCSTFGTSTSSSTSTSIWSLPLLGLRLVGRYWEPAEPQERRVGDVPAAAAGTSAPEIPKSEFPAVRAAASAGAGLQCARGEEVTGAGAQQRAEHLAAASAGCSPSWLLHSGLGIVSFASAVDGSAATGRGVCAGGGAADGVAAAKSCGQTLPGGRMDLRTDVVEAARAVLGTIRPSAAAALRRAVDDRHWSLLQHAAKCGWSSTLGLLLLRGPRAGAGSAIGVTDVSATAVAAAAAATAAAGAAARERCRLVSDNGVKAGVGLGVMFDEGRGSTEGQAPMGAIMPLQRDGGVKMDGFAVVMAEPTLLHLAVSSGVPGAVDAIVAAAADRCRNGLYPCGGVYGTWSTLAYPRMDNYLGGGAASSGYGGPVTAAAPVAPVTPLQVAAALRDGGALLSYILSHYPDAAAMYGKERPVAATSAAEAAEAIGTAVAVCGY